MTNYYVHTPDDYIGRVENTTTSCTFNNWPITYPSTQWDYYYRPTWIWPTYVPVAIPTIKPIDTEDLTDAVDELSDEVESLKDEIKRLRKLIKKVTADKSK